jgi:drug/metabolite transporter (DMT)-like permease
MASRYLTRVQRVNSSRPVVCLQIVAADHRTRAITHDRSWSMKENPYPRARSGKAMGFGATVLWSTASASIVFGGRQLGVWQFLALTTLTAGLLQLLGYLVMGRTLRSLLMPPLKLWLAMLLGFVSYLLFLSLGLATASTDSQTVGVSLMNYLWPTLTVLFTIWLVPGEKMDRRLAIGICLSLSGVVLANWGDIVSQGPAVSFWPHALGVGAAVFWAFYCALTSRWREWAKDYAAAPLGFLVVGIVATGICTLRHEWQPMSERAWWTVALSALGPWAGGYMLWELALHRAAGTTLGLIGAAAPVLSTLILLGLLASGPGGSVKGNQVAILLAASVLIALAVVLRRPPSGRT